jgi:hypothetical protein
MSRFVSRLRTLLTRRRPVLCRQLRHVIVHLWHSYSPRVLLGSKVTLCRERFCFVFIDDFFFFFCRCRGAIVNNVRQELSGADHCAATTRAGDVARRSTSAENRYDRYYSSKCCASFLIAITHITTTTTGT